MRGGDDPQPLDDPAQRERLETFLTWAMPVFGFFIPVDLAVWLVLGEWENGALAVVLMVVFACLVAARRALRRGRIDRAVVLVAGSFLLPPVVIVFLRPHLYPVLAVGTLVSVAVGMAFVRTERVLRLGVAAWSVAAFVTVTGSVLARRNDLVLPEPYRTLSLALALLVVVALVIVMLWQFHGRLRQTVEETRRAHAELAASNARLRSADAAKTRFLNVAAHELNTPLTPIRLRLYMLRTRHADGMSAEARRAVEVVERNLDRVIALVADILDASRIEASRLVLRRARVDVGGIVHDVVATVEEAANANGVEVDARVRDGTVVDADPSRLAQVVLNLLSNAVKFTARGGKVRVAVDVVGGEAVVTVSDDGVGVAPEDVAKLFQPFSQVGDPKRAVGGTGLGLHIVRGIVEAHGGRVWCASPGLGRGATFGFALPLARAEAATVPAVAD